MPAAVLRSEAAAVDPTSPTNCPHVMDGWYYWYTDSAINHEYSAAYISSPVAPVLKNRGWYHPTISGRRCIGSYYIDDNSDVRAWAENLGEASAKYIENQMTKAFVG